MKALNELGLTRIRGAHGECGGAVTFGAANDQKELSPTREVENDFRWRRMQLFELAW